MDGEGQGARPGCDWGSGWLWRGRQAPECTGLAERGFLFQLLQQGLEAGLCFPRERGGRQWRVCWATSQSTAGEGPPERVELMGNKKTRPSLEETHHIILLLPLLLGATSGMPRYRPVQGLTLVGIHEA